MINCHMINCWYRVRQYDTRERHTCNTERRCRNVLIDLHQTCGSALGYTQCKCVDVNGVRSEQLAVGGFDSYIRLYDLRLLSLSYPSTNLSPTADPSCLAHFGPGHVTRNRFGRSSTINYASTYVAFSPCGQELLANLSGEQVYLYNTVTLDALFQYNIDEDTPSLSHSLSPLPLHDQSCSHTGYLVNLKESDVPLSARTLRNKGNECYQKKQYTQAILLYSSALTECPHWHILYSNRATALVSRNW